MLRKYQLETALEQFLAYCEMVDWEVIKVYRQWDRSITVAGMGPSFFIGDTSGVMVKIRTPNAAQHRDRIYQRINRHGCLCCLLDEPHILNIPIWASKS